MPAHASLNLGASGCSCTFYPAVLFAERGSIRRLSFVRQNLCLQLCRKHSGCSAHGRQREKNGDDVIAALTRVAIFSSRNAKKLIYNFGPGLPDGIFSHQNLQFG
jgi:hypothetical protein